MTPDVEIPQVEQSTEPGYTAPIVLEAGAVAVLTLGKNRNDSADDTEYRN